MPELWRLTRTPYGRAVYDWFARRGLTAARMHEYVTDLDGDAPAPSLPGDLALDVVDAASTTGEHEHSEELAGDEVVVAASAGRADARGLLEPGAADSTAVGLIPPRRPARGRSCRRRAVTDSGARGGRRR
jgi:hypothetical protein